MDWSPKLESLSKIFAKLTTGGITPTGPAIREAIKYFNKSSIRKMVDEDEQYFEETL